MINRKKVHAKLLWENLEETLSRIEHGETSQLEVAKTLEFISHILANQSLRQIPSYILSFLSRRIDNSISKMDANEGFKISKRNGRPPTLSYREELRLANIVYDFHIIQGMTREKACFEVVHLLEKLSKQQDEYYRENNLKNWERPLKSHPCLAFENIINILLKRKNRNDLDGQIKNYYKKHKKKLQEYWNNDSPTILD